MMLHFVVASILIALCHASQPDQPSKPDTVLRFQRQPGTTPFQEEWRNFKDKYGKRYENTSEEAKRREIFRNNLEKIELHNGLYDKGETTFHMAVNEFADMELGEFVAARTGLLPTQNGTGGSTYMSPGVPVRLPREVDWRTKGLVTGVKNQAACGSCWAFSATGSLEGQHAKKTGHLVSLSEQQLVDCSGAYGNHGCNGGLMDNAFRYIRANGGIDTELCYPYTAREGMCRFDPSCVGATVTGFIDIPSGNEKKLQEATALVGPISIAIDANHNSFRFYSGGVYVEPECSQTQLDHGVLVVGYGSLNGQDYWIVKNSWGRQWGLDGYIWMARNHDNQCGVATVASYPLV